MGTYFNPHNESFTRDKNSKIYIDKTGLLDYLNDVICTNSNCIAVSHARRFGKSHAAGMIDAYYSLGCDSSNLFDDLTARGCYCMLTNHNTELINELYGNKGYTIDVVSVKRMINSDASNRVGEEVIICNY